MATRPIILGRYSPSQNGIVVSPKGIALCLAGGAMATIQTNPKFSSSMTYEKCPVCCDTIAAHNNHYSQPFSAGSAILVLGSLQNHAAVVDLRGGAITVLVWVQQILGFLK